MNVPSFLLVHRMTVEPQIGESGLGDVYGPPVTVPCFVDEARNLVRNKSGAEVVSEATAYCDLSAESWFPLDSRVTLPSGRVTYVLSAKRRDDGGMGGPQHLEVTLK